MTLRFAGLLLPFALLSVCSGCGDSEVGALRVVSLGSGGSSARCNLDIPVSAFRQEFEDILDAIDARYAFMEMKGIDVAELRSVFGPEIDRATNAEAFYATLVRLFATLHNSHSGLLLPSTAFFQAAFDSALIGDRLYLTGTFADVTLAERGLARGWEIASIDGMPFVDWLAQRMQITSASTPQYARAAAAGDARRRFWFEPSVRHYRLVSPQGATLDLDLSLDQPQGTSGSPTVVTSRLLGAIGYVAVNALTGDVVAQFEAELAKVIGSSALILDLRRNTGGNSPLGHPIIAHLIERPTPVVLPDQTLQPHPTLRYPGPLVVLVGPVTHSAAESLAHNLYDAHRATFIGAPTAGSSGNGPEVFQTNHGVVFRIPTRRGPDRSISGAIMEGAGLTPHILKDQTYEDFLASRDTVLGFAQTFLATR
jgi:carboxyl-terminal processing protease